MASSLEFLLGLLEEADPACVSQEDWDSEHHHSLQLWQEMEFLDREPGVNPIVSCPYCEEGVPYAIEGRLLCNHCFSTVQPRFLLLWQLHLEPLLLWLVDQWPLKGGARRVDERLWQLGRWEGEGGPLECFFRREGPISDLGKLRLAAYRDVLLLSGLAPPTDSERQWCRHLSLLDLLRLDDSLSVRDLAPLLRPQGNVRFDRGTGTLWAGEHRLGEVPVGSKEAAFLRYLADHLDEFVAYADIKREVLKRTGSRDETEEATFCHQLKNRIKTKGWVPMIDQLLVTTNKGDGYRLRAYYQGQ